LRPAMPASGARDRTGAGFPPCVGGVDGSVGWAGCRKWVVGRGGEGQEYLRGKGRRPPLQRGLRRRPWQAAPEGACGVSRVTRLMDARHRNVGGAGRMRVLQISKRRCGPRGYVPIEMKDPVLFLFGTDKLHCYSRSSFHIMNKCTDFRSASFRRLRNRYLEINLGSKILALIKSEQHIQHPDDLINALKAPRDSP
jgi:hypothetical protein